MCKCVENDEFFKEEVHVNDNIVNKDNEEIEMLSGSLDSEELLGRLAYIDEAERLDRLYKDYETSEEVLWSELYKEGMQVAEVITQMTKEMVAGGIDYNNALAISSNYITSKQNLELAKYNTNVVMQQNTI